MKKKMLSLVLTGVLAVSLLAGCGGSGDDAASTDSTDAVTEEDAAADADDAAAADTASGEGSVYYLNFKPEQISSGRTWRPYTQNRRAYR